MTPTERLIAAALSAAEEISPDAMESLLAEPAIIVSAPRSGSNLLFELMSQVENLWTIGGESHTIFNAFPHLGAENARLDSGRLGEAHADPQTCNRFRAIFLYLLRDKHKRRLLSLPADERPTPVPALEKTPRNALNIPFLLKVFPNARFILLYREPRANVASLVEAWKVGLQTGRFVTFRDLPGWDRPAWCFLLPPGWRSMIGRSLVEIAAFQWQASNSIILDQLARLPRERWTAVSYPELVGDPTGVRGKLCRYINPDLQSDPVPLGRLPLSRTTLTPPHPEKWKKYEREMTALLPALDAVSHRIEEMRETGSD